MRHTSSSARTSISGRWSGTYCGENLAYMGAYPNKGYMVAVKTADNGWCGEKSNYNI